MYRMNLIRSLVLSGLAWWSGLGLAAHAQTDSSASDVRKKAWEYLFLDFQRALLFVSRYRVLPLNTNAMRALAKVNSAK